MCIGTLRKATMGRLDMLPNKALQATAAVLRGLEVARRHDAVVADASALPAAVPELGREAASRRARKLKI